MFAQLGEISSVKVNKDESGNLLAEGYVCFVDSAAAEEAIKQMNKKQLDGENFLIVQKHIKRQENELTKGNNHISLIDYNKQTTFNSNVYVKFIPLETT